jgi:hypothetical protein
MLLRPRRLIGVRARVHGVESAQAIDCLDGVENWWLAGAAGKP